MNRNKTLITSLVIWASIYSASVFMVPRLEPMRLMSDSLKWLGSGDITQTSILVLTLLAIVLVGKRDFRRFGFKAVRPSLLIKPVLLAAVFELALFVLGIIVMVVFEGTGDVDVAAGDVPNESKGPFDLGLTKLFFSVIIYASVVEEIFFRGLCQSLLERYRSISFPMFKVRISLPVALFAFLFGIGHFCLYPAISGVFLAQVIISCVVLGLVAGYYREKTGSLLPAIVAHSTANIIGIVIPMILMSFPD